MAGRATPSNADATLTYGDSRVDLDAAETLEEFLKERKQLTSEERRRIVDEVIQILENLYVHLPQKRENYGDKYEYGKADPVTRLHTLREQLEDGSKPASQPDDSAFHNELVDILNSLRDLHTGYIPPAPFSKAIAFLPFEVEEYFDKDGRPRYVVANIDEGLDWFDVPDDFVRGVEVTHWNGVPISEAIDRSGDQHPGANEGARRALGLDRLTALPLAKSRVPDAIPITVAYTSSTRGRLESLTVGWRVARIIEENRRVPPAEPSRAKGQGLDDGREAIRHLRLSERRPTESRRLREKTVGALRQSGPLEVVRAFPDYHCPELPEHCEAKIFKASSGKEYGYIRIRSFKVARHRSYLRRFARLLAQMPLEGLVIDVRDNPGGLILAAERLLQLFTPQQIKPEKGEFRISTLSRDLCALVPEYMWWRESITKALNTIAENGPSKDLEFSGARELSPPAMCNNVGQRYYGPVVLVTNALSYSATEMFAAGFQDHGIGLVLGTDERTGGGGANVITRSTMRRNYEATAKAAAVFPGNNRPTWPLQEAVSDEPDLRVAIRRTKRVKKNDDKPLEGEGVKRDREHRMTLNDLLYANRDLLDTAAGVLEETRKERGSRWLREISCEEERQPDGRSGVIAVEMQSAGIETFKVTVEHGAQAQPGPSVEAQVKGDCTTVEVPWQSEAPAKCIKIEGYRGNALVAARTVRLRRPGSKSEKRPS